MAMTSWRDATLWRNNVFYYTSKKSGVLMVIHLLLTVYCVLIQCVGKKCCKPDYYSCL